MIRIGKYGDCVHSQLVLKKKKKKIIKVITIIQNCSHKLVTILGLKKIGPGILLYHKDFNRLKFSAKKEILVCYKYIK